MTRPNNGPFVRADVDDRKHSPPTRPIIYLAVALAGCLTYSAAAAAATPAASAGREAAGYATVQESSKLKWRPHRPVKVTADRRSSVSRSASQPGRRVVQRPTRLAAAAAENPFNDPFGDAKPKRKPAASTEILDGKAAETPKSPSQVDEPLPDLAVPEADPTPAATVPSREEELSAARGVEDECPTAADFKKIGELTYKIEAEDGEFPTECPLTKDKFQGRSWATTNFAWKASGLCHKPLYFEQARLERYGHSWGPYLQPVISGGTFFLTVPALPYLMGINPPNECVYSLGYYRPGSCAPYLLDPLPISIRGALWEAGIATGMACVLP